MHLNASPDQKDGGETCVSEASIIKSREATRGVDGYEQRKGAGKQQITNPGKLFRFVFGLNKVWALLCFFSSEIV